ncbi:MAG: UvrB/UvrC motif-containing protein [Planctomycetota bacterium]|jgi:protein arginine kinase activator
MGKLCQSCNQREAKIHFTELKDGKKTEMHLCEHCAQEKNMVLAFPSLLSTLVKGGEEKGEADAVPATCPGCGLAYSDFKAKGRLGCPQCYEVFAPVLVPLLVKVHSHAEHKGRHPLHQPEPQAAPPVTEPIEEPEPQPLDETMQLRLELADAVEAEDYERAAELRDQIRALEGDEG